LGLPAVKLAKLQEGLAKLQAEGVLEGLKGVLEGLKAAKAAKAAGTKAVLAALDDLLSANGLVPAEVKGFIDPHLVSQARTLICVKQGAGLGAARLAKLQEGLAKLQAEGVLEGLKAAKAKAAKAQRSAVGRRQAAKPPPTKRQRISTSTTTGKAAGGGGGGGGGGGSGGGGSSSDREPAFFLDDRFHIGAGDQAADL
jgi:uncharacterized membrane protein YgcG